MPVIERTAWLKRWVRRLPWMPWMFLRIYVYPLLVRGRRARMDPKDFFDRHYQAAASDELRDADTLSAEYDDLHAHLHYNAVEASILRILAEHPEFPRVRLLDVGSGTGHWIDFYRRIFPGIHCVAAELSDPAARYLERKYAEHDDVDILQCDITRDELGLEGLSIINAIGVLFHIVDDEALERALRQFVMALAPGGLLIVGGHFGLMSRDIMFERMADEVNVTKRVRSARWWRRVAGEIGLQVVRIERTKNPPGYLFPENDVLVLRRPLK